MLSVSKTYWWAGLLMLERFAGLSCEDQGQATSKQEDTRQ